MAGDLISREYLLGVIGKMPIAWEYGQAVKDIYEIIENAPAVNAEEITLGHWHHNVRSALVRWKDGEPVWEDRNVYYCIKCGYGTIIQHNYCPRCGAKMK